MADLDAQQQARFDAAKAAAREWSAGKNSDPMPGGDLPLVTGYAAKIAHELDPDNNPDPGDPWAGWVSVPPTRRQRLRRRWHMALSRMRRSQ